MICQTRATAFIWQLQSLSVMDVALELKRVIVTNLIRVSYCCIAVTFTLTFLLNSCTQAASWSTLVIKVDLVCVGICILRCLKEELA